jgi:hypothetical protein
LVAATSGLISAAIFLCLRTLSRNFDFGIGADYYTIGQ